MAAFQAAIGNIFLGSARRGSLFLSPFDLGPATA